MNKKTTKIIRILILIFLFLLPWQTRYVYREAFLNGGVWEYGRLSLFGTEIFLGVIVLLYAYQRFFNKKIWRKILNRKHFKKQYKYLLFMVCFLLFNIVVVVNSYRPELSWQHFNWVLGGICLSIIISETFRGRDQLQGVLAVWLSAVLQGVLAIGQFVLQSVFASKWLGMASQYPHNAGVSVIEFADQRWLRAYGSLSWPNMLGGFLAVGLLLGLYLLVEKGIARKWYFSMGQIIILIGLILSFSRAAWLAMLVSLAVWVFLLWCKKMLVPYYGRQLLYYLFTVLLAIILLAPLFEARFNLNNRVEYVSYYEHKMQYSQASQMISRQALFGVGQLNYTWQLFLDYPQGENWQYQPVHNIYLLILAEVGLIGFVLYFLLHFFLIKKLFVLNPLYLPIVSVLAIHGWFDHWYWTLYVGVVFWWAIWGLGLLNN